MSIDQRLDELGIELPAPPSAIAAYVPCVVSGSYAFVAGQIPMVDGAVRAPGHVGADVSIEEAFDGARRCALQALSALKAELGSLDRVKRIVKLEVLVASAPAFTSQPMVANGASELLVEIFGDAGKHARAAYGVAELPLGSSVEVVVTAEISETAGIS